MSHRSHVRDDLDYIENRAKHLRSTWQHMGTPSLTLINISDYHTLKGQLCK